MEGSHSVIDHTEILNWLPFVRFCADTKYGMFCILDASTSHPSFISPWIMERSPPLILVLIKKMGRIFAMIYDYRRGHFNVLYSLVLPSVRTAALTLLSWETSNSVLPWREKQSDLESRPKVSLQQRRQGMGNNWKEMTEVEVSPWTNKQSSEITF